MMDTRREPPQAEEISLLDLAAVLVRRWRLVVGSVLATVLLAVALLAVLPDRYVARAVIMPSPDKPAGRGQMLAGQLPAGFAGLISPGSNEKTISAVLKSRTLADSIVSRMGFPPYGRTRGEGEIRKVLGRGTNIQPNPDGSFTIEVRDVDPERAARIANEVPEMTNVILSDLVTHAAQRKLAFLEQQVLEANERLERSEREVVAFQQTQDAPEFQEQTRRTLEAAAALQQEIIEQEIRVAQLRRTATADNPELRAAVADLSARKGQLARLTEGQGSEGRIFLSLQQSPELRATVTRVLREYTRNEQTYLSLAAAFTEAQMDARNDLPVVTVLDAAIVPQGPSRRNPGLVLGVAAFLGSIIGVVLAYGSEYVRNARSNPVNKRFFIAWTQLKDDISRFSPKRRGQQLPERAVDRPSPR